MRWAAEGFIAVDWGTTNRRAYLMGADGSCREEMEDDKGILSVSKGGFEEAVREIRERFGNRPLLLGGMVGSNRGWVEAAYVPCPAGLDDLVSRLVWPEERRTAIVPGVCLLDGDTADVMRGEEIQILGAYAARRIPADALVCHPGTHNKWIQLERGRIARFTTVMTGELFSLLRERSILSDFLSGQAEAGDAFERGVRRGLEGDGLTAELFRIRARILLGQSAATDAASYASGLLIGTDVRTGLSGGPDAEVIVMGRPDLTRLYVEALRVAGRSGRELEGESTFMAGAVKIAELIG
jgi:2-dehydro-3-deoxygalactonokinase